MKHRNAANTHKKKRLATGECGARPKPRLGRRPTAQSCQKPHDACKVPCRHTYIYRTACGGISSWTQTWRSTNHCLESVWSHQSGGTVQACVVPSLHGAKMCGARHVRCQAMLKMRDVQKQLGVCIIVCFAHAITNMLCGPHGNKVCRATTI